MDRIFFPTNTVDPSTQLPIYILDSHFLPSTKDVDYDTFLPLLLNSIPNFTASRYCLVFFSGALSSNEHISWVYGIKFFKQLTSLQMRSCAKIYIVHESWWIKTVANLLGNLNAVNTSSKRLISFTNQFRSGESLEVPPENQFVHCESISALSQHINITQIKISLVVYKHDLLASTADLNNNLYNLPVGLQGHLDSFIGSPIVFDDTGEPANLTTFHFNSLFHILGQNVPILRTLPNFFHNPGNKSSNRVLYDCINRNQLFNINDWDLYNIGFIFKKFFQFHDLTHPLLPVSCIAIPARFNDLEYVNSTFEKITKSGPGIYEIYACVVPFFRQVISYDYSIDDAGDDESPPDSSHTRYSIAKAFSHVFTLESYNSRESVSSATDFLASLIRFWEEIPFHETRQMKTVVAENLFKQDEEKPFHPMLPHKPSSLSMASTQSSEVSAKSVSSTTPVNSNTVKKPRQNTEWIGISPTISLPNSSYETDYTPNYDPVKDKKPPQAVSVALVELKKNLKPSPQLKKKQSFRKSVELPIVIPEPMVAQGRKVSQLARIYEERLRGIEELSR